MIEDNLHTILDEYFEKNNLSSYKVAEQTGLSQPTIGRYRKGKSSPTSNNWKILVATYNDLQSFVDRKIVEKARFSTEGNKSNTQQRIEKNNVELGLENYSPLEILNYIHLNIDLFKDEPLYKMIEKEAVSVYKSDKESGEIKDLIVKSLNEYLGKGKNKK